MKTHKHNDQELKSDIRGIAMLEFALAMPIFLILIFGIIEVNRYQQFHQKLSNGNNQVMNLINQNLNISGQSIDKIVDMFMDIMTPYDTSTTVIFVSALQQDSNPEIDKRLDVKWQVVRRKNPCSTQECNNLKSKFAPLGAGSRTTVSGLNLSERDQIIIVEIYIKYKALLDIGVFSKLDYTKDYNYKFSMARPRYGAFQFAPN